MGLPKSLDQITISQYQEVLPIYKEVQNETDSLKWATGWCCILSALTGKTFEYYESLDLKKLEKLIAQCHFLSIAPKSKRIRKYLLIRGTLYKAVTDIDNLSTGRNIDIHEFSKKGVVGEFHNLASTVYAPLTWKGFKRKDHSKHSEKFKSVKLGRVYPTVFFYSNKLNSLIASIGIYGELEVIRKMEQAKKERRAAWEEIQKEISLSIGDGL